MPHTTAATAPRQFYLDWLRIIAFALLVPYHVGMYYVGWQWHIKSAQPLPALEPWMRLVSPWRMDLLFLVSGAATSLMWLRRGGVQGALRERAKRLLWPLLLGVLVVVPPQSYFEVVQQHAYLGSYFDFLRLYLSGYGGFCTKSCLILPTWNHLWYLPYLFVYTALLWLALRRWPQLLDQAAQRLARAMGGAGWLLWLIVPLAWLILTRLMLRQSFPVTRALVDDWFSHSQYLAMFLFGALFARANAVTERMQQLRWWALPMAAAAGVLLLSLPLSPGYFAARVFAFSLLQWCAIVAAIGFARRHLNSDAPLRRSLTQAVFPLYILHQTLTILLAQALRPLALAPEVEAPLLVLGTFALGWLGYAIARRVPWLRTPFGLRAEPAAGPLTPPASPGAPSPWCASRPTKTPRTSPSPSRRW